jgi:hypothetical protein
MDPDKLRAYLKTECIPHPRTGRVVSQRTGGPVRKLAALLFRSARSMPIVLKEKPDHAVSQFSHSEPIVSTPLDPVHRLNGGCVGGRGSREDRVPASAGYISERETVW